MGDRMEIIDWQDRAADKKACAEIITRHHPDGIFTLIKDYEIIGDEEDISVQIDPAIGEAIVYFVDKYGHERGMKIWDVFFGEAFGHNFFKPSLD